MKKFEFNDFHGNCKDFLQMNSNQPLLQAIYLFHALNGGRVAIYAIEEFVEIENAWLVNGTTVVDTANKSTCDLEFL